MALNNKQMESYAKRSATSEFLWYLSFILSITATILLFATCLFMENGILVQAQPKPRPTLISNQNSNANETSATRTGQTQADVALADSSRNGLIQLEARTDEMSKRIEEVGSHSTQVLNVIGLLIAFTSAVVAIGLWQSKQYIDRVVEHYKTEMKNFIREETEKQLNEMKSTMSEQFQNTIAKSTEEIDKQKTILIETLKERAGETTESIQTLFESHSDTYQRLGSLLIERIPQVLDKAFDIALDKGLISSENRQLSRDELDLAVYTQEEILRALIQLESLNGDEVITGCHTISALKDKSCIPLLKQALTRWRKGDDTRVVEQISYAYERLRSLE